MIEKSPLSLTPKRHLARAASVFALALAGCGGNSFTANHVRLSTCGSKDYNKATTPITVPKSAMAFAGRNILKLQKRALAAGGSIDLPRYIDDTEVHASSDSVSLTFRRTNFEGDASDGRGALDVVTFPIKGHTVELSEGAILCFKDAGLVTNGTYQSLQEYATQTIALDK